MTVVCHRGPAWRRTGDVMPGDGAGMAGGFAEDVAAVAAAECNPAPGADPSETMASSAAEASRLMR